MSGGEESAPLTAESDSHLGTWDVRSGVEAEEPFDSAQEFQVPDWMLAAVASQPKAGGEEPEDEVWEN